MFFISEGCGLPVDVSHRSYFISTPSLYEVVMSLSMIREMSELLPSFVSATTIPSLNALLT